MLKTVEIDENLLNDAMVASGKAADETVALALRAMIETAHQRHRAIMDMVGIEWIDPPLDRAS